MRLLLLWNFFYGLCLLPQFFLNILLRLSLKLWTLLSKTEARAFSLNVKYFWGLSSSSSFGKLFSKQLMRHQLSIALETLQAAFFPSKLKVSGLAELKTFLQEHCQEEKGCIIVTGHVGNWELSGSSCAKVLDKKFSVLAKASRYDLLNLFLEKLRRRLSMSVLWTERRSLLRDMIKTLHKGESLGFVMDQKPQKRLGPKVSFCGIETEFVSGPAKLAMSLKLPVVAVYCIRQGPRQYRLITESIAKKDHNFINELVLTQKLASSIENMALTYPEQWCWNYKRWNEKSLVASPSFYAKRHVDSLR